MLQQIIAIIIIAFFLSRLIWQKKKKEIQAGEFIFWLFFWIFTGLAIALLKWIDRFVAFLGFTGSGIEVLIYIAVAILFYFIFRMRLRLEKMEKEITRLVSYLAISEAKRKEK